MEDKKTMSLRLYLDTHERLQRAKYELGKTTFDETLTALLDALPDQRASGPTTNRQHIAPVEEQEEEEKGPMLANLRLHRDTHRRLRRVKHELEKESFDEAIRVLLAEHYGLKRGEKD